MSLSIILSIDFGDGPRSQRALATDNVEVERRESLIGWKMAQQRARRRICLSIAIANFAHPDVRRHVSTNMWSPNALIDATQRRLIAVMRRFMQRTNHFFAKYGGNDTTRKDGELVAML